jgi:hypothetical protein
MRSFGGHARVHPNSLAVRKHLAAASTPSQRGCAICIRHARRNPIDVTFAALRPEYEEPWTKANIAVDGRGDRAVYAHHIDPQ